MIKYRRPALASELFRAITTASLAEIWAAPTATGSPLGYLYGLTAESDWQPGAALTMTLDQWCLFGDVLVADHPRRLCYTLGDRPGEPSVYVTWELRPLDDATVIRLTVDEPWPLTEDTTDLEDAWLPVLSGLVAELSRPQGALMPDRLPSCPGPARS
jgi:Activator of Hsp90 ATPase homolog 1-like protein